LDEHSRRIISLLKNQADVSVNVTDIMFQETRKDGQDDKGIILQRFSALVTNVSMRNHYVIHRRQKIFEIFYKKI
jgi:hypothetical protein